jgi:hypothetical protein
MNERKMPNYDDFVDLQLEILTKDLGFPWPPGPEPHPGEWWRNETTVLPNRKLLSNRYPNLRLIDINTPPKFGKSTLLNAVDDCNFPGGWQVSVSDEDYIKTTNKHLIVDPAVVFPPADLADIEDDIVYSFPKNSEDEIWPDQLFMQLFKLHYWENKISSLQQTATGNREATMHISARGPLDTIIWQMSLLTHQGDPAFTIPPVFREDYTKHSRFVISRASILLLNNFDAVILGGISQEESNRRRLAEGKTKPGFVAGSPFYQTMLGWQGFMANQVLSKMHEKLGIGYMIINGERPVEVVQQQIINYVKEIAK